MSDAVSVEEEGARVKRAERALVEARQEFYEKVARNLPDRVAEYARGRAIENASTTDMLNRSGRLRSLRDELDLEVERMVGWLRESAVEGTPWPDEFSGNVDDRIAQVVAARLDEVVQPVNAAFAQAGYPQFVGEEFRGANAFEVEWLGPVGDAGTELRNAQNRLRVAEQSESRARAAAAWDSAR